MAYTTELGSYKKSFTAPAIPARLLAYISHPHLIVRILVQSSLVYHTIILSAKYTSDRGQVPWGQASTRRVYFGFDTYRP